MRASEQSVLKIQGMMETGVSLLNYGVCAQN
jgi:hypothetical protein